MFVVVISSLPVGCIDAEIEKVVGPFTSQDAADAWCRPLSHEVYCMVVKISPVQE
jgi:hypothetical protein